MPPRLYTLTEAAEATGISIHTLLRYKDDPRIDHLVAGNRVKGARVYTRAALSMFQRMKEEGYARQGRPKTGPGHRRIAMRRLADQAVGKKIAADPGEGSRIIRRRRAAELLKEAAALLREG